MTVSVLSQAPTGELHLAGLSTDVKPAPRSGDTFQEFDTGKAFAGNGTAWAEAISPSVATAAALSAHNHAGTYEPANANIQAHVAAAHAPPGAQANADITKAEIEAKLTGTITSHSHAGGTAQLVVPIGAVGAFTWTNMPAAVTLLGSSAASVARVDLAAYTQCRLTVTKMAVAGAAASKVILRYKTTFDTAAANYLDIGTSEVSVAVNVANTGLASSWIDLAAGAKADVFVAVVGSGGDGVLDPAFGVISAQFK